MYNYDNASSTCITGCEKTAHCSSCGNIGKCKKGCGITMGSRPTSKRFCNNEVTLTPNDPNYVSSNQRLAGTANPKTFISPVIVPPETLPSRFTTGSPLHKVISSPASVITFLLN